MSMKKIQYLLEKINIILSMVQCGDFRDTGKTTGTLISHLDIIGAYMLTPE